jgi:tetratricopeptide (TPR) repeat protein
MSRTATAQSIPPAEPSPGRRPGPWCTEVDGIHVLKVKGSFYEMGRQHGEMLRAQVPVGPLPYFREHMERMMGESEVGALAPLLWPIVQRLIGRRVAGKMPAFARDTVRGLADGAGMPEQILLDGATMPDSLLVVASAFMRFKKIGPAVQHRLALGLGCTSAIAWGDATKDGRLLHARNFDYHGVGCWPDNAAVIFHEPDEGQRFVSVSAAGVPLGGATAMNESGLTLTVHQHMFTDRASMGGLPIGLTGDVIMREATTLDEAEEILKAQVPIGCWTYLITDGNRREVLCWEENPDRNAAKRVGNGDGASTFRYTNIYLDRPLGDTEVNLYGSYWRHNYGRYRRAGQLLQDQAGSLDPLAMASILGDTGDGDCRIHHAIGMLMTVGSVVFRPEDGALWVGSGVAPTSHGQFIPFDLSQEAHAPEHGRLDGSLDRDPVAAEAFDEYRRGYLAYADDRDVTEARRRVRRALELQPGQALYHCVDGLLALRDGEPATAFDAFGRALEIGHVDGERVAAFHLWRGRAADLTRRREEARSHYRASLGHPADPPVHKAALRGLSKPWRKRKGKHIDIDFTFADVVSP